MSGVGFSLSLSDLILIPKFQKAFGENNKEEIYKILFENGMDVTSDEPVEEIVCTHRNLRGKVVNCLRYESNERTDRQWIESGAASWDAQVAACEDQSMRVELRVMGRQGSVTGQQLDYIATEPSPNKKKAKKKIVEGSLN